VNGGTSSTIVAEPRLPGRVCDFSASSVRVLPPRVVPRHRRAVPEGCVHALCPCVVCILQVEPKQSTSSGGGSGSAGGGAGDAAPTKTSEGTCTSECTVWQAQLDSELKLPCQEWRSCCHACHMCPGLGVAYGHDIAGPEPGHWALSHSNLRLAHVVASAR
jgi:hypothetical protein